MTSRAHHTLAVALASAFALLALPAPSAAAVLARDLWLMPLAPDAGGPHRQLRVDGLDPGKPVWIAYRLVAVAPSLEPEGTIRLEGVLEGVPTNPAQMVVSLDADDLKQAPSAGTIGTLLEQQIGKRSPDQLRAMMGPDLYAAFEALNARRGSILDGATLRHHPAPGLDEATVLVSIEEATGIQPMLIELQVGQDEPPPGFRATMHPVLRSLLALGTLALLLAGIRRLFRRREA